MDSTPIKRMSELSKAGGPCVRVCSCVGDHMTERRNTRLSICAPVMCMCCCEASALEVTVAAL